MDRSMKLRASCDLLEIDPPELRFPFEPGKQIWCSIQLSNKVAGPIAFNIQSTNRQMYTARPSIGIISRRSTREVVVMRQAQREAPSDIQCEDEFREQIFVNLARFSEDDVRPEMFSKGGRIVDEVILRAVYVSPPKPSFLERSYEEMKGYDEESSCWASAFATSRPYGNVLRRRRNCNLTEQ